MDPLPFSQFVEIVGGEVVGGGNVPADLAVEHVATHSARIRSGAAFFALAGARSDGHGFVADAARNGATVVVVDRRRLDDVREALAGPAEVDGAGGLETGTVPVVAVDNPLRSLQRLAGWWRRCLSTRFVAVVGSNGKTITKDCLVDILSRQHPVYGTPGSYNSQLGVPLAVLDCPRNAATAVIEIAVSDPGEMQHLARIVSPHDVVLTNVGTRWRYRFADREQQIRELLAIAEEVPTDGWILLGQDDDDLQAAAALLPGARTVHVQGASGALPGFTRLTQHPGPAEIEITYPGSSGPVDGVSVQTPSDEILGDVELAVSAAWLLGIDADAIGDALRDYTPTSTRMEIWRSPSGVTLVRDVATPDPIAVSSAVRTAQRLTKQGGRTIVVLSQPGPEHAPGLPWDRDAAVGLAHALVAEHVDEVFGLAPPPASPSTDDDDGTGTAALTAVAAIVEELDDVIPVRLFESTEALRTHLVDHLEFGDVCLVQSPPGQPMGDISSSLVEAMAPTRLYLDLSAMEENVTTYRRLLGPSVRITAMVKALAYGTDAVAVSLGLHDSGIDYLGVSGADEGIALRRAGVNLPILVMLGTPDEIEKMVRYRLTPMLYSPQMVDAVTPFAKNETAPVGVHVEVDTGMHRTGLSPAQAVEALPRLSRERSIRVEGIMTHFASADDPGEDAFTLGQLARLDEVLEVARTLGLDPLVHAGATAGAIRFPSARHDMVRIGLGLFGVHPSPATAREVTLAPVISLVSRIVQVVDVPAGERVGYGGTYTAPAGGGRVGVVPAGYHDCIPRAFSNHGHVVVGGARCDIVGTVSMDSMTIDLSGCPDAGVGSDVLIYGRRGDWNVPLEEVSAVIGTIPYEVMARVGPRVQRVFTRH